MQSQGAVAAPYVAGPLRLRPFRALMLAPGRIGDAGLGRAFDQPRGSVVAQLADWFATGQISRSPGPALYLHEYSTNGLTVRGLVGALEVSRRAREPSERAVWPHEAIYPTQADNLADRMDRMRINPAPILLVHRSSVAMRERLATVSESPPSRAFTDRNDQHHQVWEITDPEALAWIDSDLAGEQALIADGHHRYAAYLRLQQRSPGSSADQGLAMLVDQATTPLFLGAVHRVLAGSSMDDLRIAATSIGARFAHLPGPQALRQLGPGRLVATDSKTWAVVDLDVPEDHATVEVVHHLLIPRLSRGPSRITHHHTAEAAVARAEPGHGTALLLPAPGVDLVTRIAAADRLLPEKATSFQPKPTPGVLIRHLDE